MIFYIKDFRLKDGEPTFEITIQNDDDLVSITANLDTAVGLMAVLSRHVPKITLNPFTAMAIAKYFEFERDVADLPQQTDRYDA